MVINPIVQGDLDFPWDDDPVEYRIQFDLTRRSEGLELAKKHFPDWQDFTLEGDPYPIPRAIPDDELEEDEPSSDMVKGQHGFLANTNDDDWAMKMVRAIRKRESEDAAEADS